jgi:ATP-dependent Lhr-like helicase
MRTPQIAAPASRTTRTWTREQAIVELLRGSMSIGGPMTARALAASLDITVADADAALLALESEGVVLRGLFTSAARDVEWCDRRLLARIHRYTLNRLRAEIAPVTPADFMRFLFAWQHVTPASRLSGTEGARAVLAQLDGVELPARAWEAHVLPARVERYEAAMLDMLCFAGEMGWARLSSGPTQVVGATPIALFRREHEDAWLTLRDAGSPELPASATLVADALRSHGASFAHQLATVCGLTADALRDALGELASAGLAASDGYSGVRALISSRQPNAAGRWFLLRRRTEAEPAARDAAVETFAWTLLHRYGVVFRRVTTREAMGVPWRELARVYRRLEARGEIRGGRFVSGMSGEQFALPDAVERLREVRRSSPDDELLVISGADPLNMAGIITPGDRLRALASTRIVYRNGVPVAAMEGDFLRTLSEVDPTIAADVAAAAAGRTVPVLKGYVGRI